MKEYINILKDTPLFQNINETQIENILVGIGAETRSYKKDETIILAGEPIRRVGIVLDGSVQVIKEDSHGDRNIMVYIEKKEIFAEAFAFAEIQKSPVSVVTAVNSKVMFIDFRRIVNSCGSSCGFQGILIQNMLRIISRKNLELNDKLSCLGKRNTAEKVKAFLGMQREKYGKDDFSISLSRAEMADYLCVDRSALSAVLSNMRNIGEIKFDKNHFELLKNFFE